jgi:hypothetical protein
MRRENGENSTFLPFFSEQVSLSWWIMNSSWGYKYKQHVQYATAACLLLFILFFDLKKIIDLHSSMGMWHGVEMLV